MWDWSGNGELDVFGHDGSTIGQAAWLRYHSKSGTVFALLTNGGNGKAVASELLREVFGEAAGIAPRPAPVARPGLKLNASRYVGRYVNVMESVDVMEEDGELVATITPSPAAAVIAGTRRVTLAPVSDELMVGVAPGYTEAATYHFLMPDSEGRAQILHSGVRAHRRVTA
jgi:hypothetical protein